MPCSCIGKLIWGSLNNGYFKSHMLRLGLLKLQLVESTDGNVLLGLRAIFKTLPLNVQELEHPLCCFTLPCIVFMLVRTCYFILSIMEIAFS